MDNYNLYTTLFNKQDAAVDLWNSFIIQDTHVEYIDSKSHDVARIKT